MKVIIIGGGISGISTGIRLREALGNRVQLTILEKKATPGGVWRDSKWPGAGVDVPIHLYSLYSDLYPDWDTVFASQPEVLAYWERLIEKYGLESSFLFHSEFVGSSWNEGAQNHSVQVRDTQTGAISELTSNVLVSAAGPLVKPLLPKIPGIQDFGGAYFHNLQWNDGVELTGKRIAVIGNGSSGIQLIPGVAALPGVVLTHYIRSGGYFIPKDQRQYSSWEKFAFRYIPGWMQLHRHRLLGLQDRFFTIRTLGRDPEGRVAAEAELLRYLRETAPSKYLEALTPRYPLGAKRTALDYGWLESLHRDNVSLVNTPITHVRPNGIETADGALREHDVIIYATGSDVPHEGIGVNRGVHGEDGRELKEFWDGIGGPQAYAGLAVPHFPNYFIVIGPNATAGSWGWTLGVQSRTIARIVKAIAEEGLTSVQPKERPFVAHNKQVQEALKTSAAASLATNNWWRTETGRITTVNPRTSKELWSEAAKQPVWEDWRALKGTQEVDMARVVRGRQLRNSAILLAALIIAYVLYIL